MKNYDVIILGAGASGLMCAANLSKKMRVAIIDSNEKPAKKLKISGGGKCNITNVSVQIDNFDGDKGLISSAFKKFSKDDLLDFLDRNRVELELRKGRYYFCKNSSDDIINVLKKNVKKSEIILNNTILHVTKSDDIFSVTTDKNIYKAKKVVVATGGKSFQTLGASDIGLKIAKSFTICVKEFTPALVGLTLQKEQFWMKNLSGLSCYVHVKVADRVLKEEMLFAHKGISGPAILSASLYWKKGDISIDFLPNKNILDLTQKSKKLVSSVIPLPKRLSKALLSAIDFKDKECSKLSKNDKELLKSLHNYTFAPAGNFGFTKAEVSRGGVLAEELDSNTLESKKVKNLYFIGEVVDVTGELGGYNFQWAFSSAYSCAKVF
ncbi:NAD(P)/FAD-dependent oxidoreductase [Sulfurimonas autotrophica]|uniref:HI0933 family protein n=1 Tax=Sulfurimonas autotrophica (strain ATCC BAA-671 / DSM 16294 / JCM 11897 / OK10) TaxID=563040 RepID=E0UPK6_SULAO|nr:aminoacetone oxidase family FAD-binding enzyme [Sulfurimonas autotrophica]ADN08598.1 HI0933 family protein [Sulfurimonas autotrophica DSM 16294]